MLVPVSEISAGEQVVVRMGNMIPLDGKVISGTAMVNQQTMTGESMPVKKAAELADRLVPYSLAGTVIAYALTRNAQTALAFLMVDYSCALKLTMPLAVLSAMRESGRHKITVKGGKFLEAVAETDTIVFDKTGTLTNATPKVA